MAEQIRSFWSHLCGIFGAIFGMIAGGTLVTIEHADAAESYSNQILSNGAIVNYKFGRYYTPYFVSYGGNGSCLKICGDSTYGCGHYSRYYVTFLGCADGYYSTGLVAENTNITLPVGTTSTLGTASTTIGTLTDRGICRTYKLCGNSTMYDAACSGSLFYSPFNGQYISYDALPETQTDGLCNKCPDYGTYAADTISAIGKGNITSCFMSPDTEYSDESDQADGVATGKFIWTNSCFYQDDTNPGLTPYCDALLAEGNDENCILYLTAVAISAGLVETTTQIVGNIYGNYNSAIDEVQYVLNNKKETLIRNSMSCSAANCYKTALKTLGGSSARIEYYYD